MLIEIGNKISQTIDVINKPEHFIPQKKLLTIYNALILPHINYCILAWGQDLKRILKLQKKQFELLLKVVFMHTQILSFKKSIFIKLYASSSTTKILF